MWENQSQHCVTRLEHFPIFHFIEFLLNVKNTGIFMFFKKVIFKKMVNFYIYFPYGNI